MSAKVSSWRAFVTCTWPMTSWSGAIRNRCVASPSGSGGGSGASAAGFSADFGFFHSDSNGVQAATSAFRRVDASWLAVAQTFGASPLRLFLRIGLPLAAPGLVAGAAMSWARALGEFGATITFAGNFPGITQTMPLAVYQTMESGDLEGAVVLSLILLAVSVTILATLRDRWLTAP